LFVYFIGFVFLMSLTFIHCLRTNERSLNAAVSLARSLDSNNSNDMAYYKRKVGELSDKLQAQQDIIMKQNSTIAELRGQNEKRQRVSY
jgi:hypothetical protein